MKTFPWGSRQVEWKRRLPQVSAASSHNEYPKKLLSACVCVFVACKKAVYIYIYMYFNICMRIKVLRGIVYTLAYFSFIYFSITMDYIYVYIYIQYIYIYIYIHKLHKWLHGIYLKKDLNEHVTVDLSWTHHQPRELGDPSVHASNEATSVAKSFGPTWGQPLHGPTKFGDYMEINLDNHWILQ